MSSGAADQTGSAIAVDPETGQRLVVGRGARKLVVASADDDRQLVIPNNRRTLTVQGVEGTT